MKPARWSVVAATLYAAPLVAAAHGGWAVITLENLPEYAVVGEPMNLEFTVRQHGVEPMSDLTPVVVATSSRGTIKEKATLKRDGRYTTALTLPAAADWTVTVHSGFHESNVTLLPIRAVAQGEARPALPDFERGRRLFVAKGCTTCHVHRDVPGSGRIGAGPDLSDRRFAGDYLARFLADPSITPPRSQERMPNLHLQQSEIRSLSAFVNAEKADR